MSSTDTRPFSALILVVLLFTSTILPAHGGGSDGAPDPYQYVWTEVSAGVWSGVRPNSQQVPVMGTSTFVVGDEGVIVYDGGGAPLMTERLMAQVASVTDLPITHLVISHWHGDHMFGVFRIVEEYPNVEVIAHPFTRAATLGRPMDYLKRSGTAVERFTPYVETRLETGLDEDSLALSQEDIAMYEAFLEHKDLLNSEFNRYAATLPTITFEDHLTIHSGDTEVQPDSSGRWQHRGRYHHVASRAEGCGHRRCCGPPHSLLLQYKSQKVVGCLEDDQ